jgi:hypothetical protein
MHQSKSITASTNSSIKRKSFFGFQQGHLQESVFFQPKLQVGPVDDVYEREADAVADRIITMSHNENSMQQISPVSVQRKCAKCQEEDEVQRKEEHDDGLKEATPIVESTIGASGKPIEDHTRSFMENRFGYDFSDVKIHNNSQAVQSAQSINALAYTSGNNIVFNEGQYAPDTSTGKKLLAHELTHVVQQNHNSILRKKVQRQHVRLNSGRFVGSTASRPLNLKEDVLEAMDTLHTMWSLSDADYIAEYPVVSALPAMSAVPVGTIPRTIAAIHTNEQPLLNDVVASHVFGLTLTASVGAGGTNNRADIYALQDYLHARWHLSTANYTAERAAVAAGSDPVNTSVIPNTLSALTLLKIAKVAEGYRPHDILAGTTALSSTQRSRVDAILVPGSTISSTGTSVAPTPDAICTTPALATEIRAAVVPYVRGRGASFRTRHGSPPVLPMPQIRSMGDIVEAEIEGYFGSYLRGATSVTGARYTFGQYSVRSQIQDQSSTLRWRTTAGRLSWIKYWISTLTGNSHHCNQADLDAVANGIATDPDATLITDIDDTINGWPAEATGGINMNPYLRDATANVDELRRARWDAFTIILHEAIHHLAHPNFVNTYNQMQNDSMQILKEGFNDLFRRELWFGAGHLGSRVGTPAYNANRTVIEGASYTYKPALVTYHGDYAQVTQAQQIEAIIGNRNAKAAYFLGHTEYLGLGAGSHGLTSAGSFANLASYHAADPAETNRVDTLPGETYAQLRTRINAGPGTIFNPTTGNAVPTSGPLPARVRVSGVRHVTVIAGDSVNSIAYQNGVTPNDILRANAMTSLALTIGQRILIPIH